MNTDELKNSKETKIALKLSFISGGRSLSESFWKVYVGGIVFHLMALFIFFIAMMAEKFDNSHYSLELSPSEKVLYAMFISLLVFVPFATLGTWRSALKQDTDRAAAILTKFVLIVGGGFWLTSLILFLLAQFY